jgi:hypothetical protein
MTHISLLVPHDCAVLDSLARVFDIFELANRRACESPGRPSFEVHLVGPDSRVPLYGGRQSVAPDLLPRQVERTDLVIVPALGGNIAEHVERNQVCVRWIAEAYQSGAAVAALCTAALLVSQSGVTNDRHGKARWFVDGAFHREFPHISLTAFRKAPHPRSISTRGGYGFFDRLLRATVGPDVSSACASAFELPFNQHCQSVLTVEPPRVHASSAHFEPALLPTSGGLTRGQFEARLLTWEPEIVAPAAREKRRTDRVAGRGGPSNSTTWRKLLRQLPVRASRSQAAAAVERRRLG